MFVLTRWRVAAARILTFFIIPSWWYASWDKWQNEPCSKRILLIQVVTLNYDRVRIYQKTHYDATTTNTWNNRLRSSHFKHLHNELRFLSEHTRLAHINTRCYFNYYCEFKVINKLIQFSIHLSNSNAVTFFQPHHLDGNKISARAATVSPRWWHLIVNKLQTRLKCCASSIACSFFTRLN